MKENKFTQTFTKGEVPLFGEKELKQIEELLKQKVSDEKIINEIAKFLVFNKFNVMQSSQLPKGTIIFGVGKKSKCDIF